MLTSFPYTIERVDFSNDKRLFEYQQLRGYAYQNEKYFDCNDKDKHKLLLDKEAYILKPYKTPIQVLWGAITNNDNMVGIINACEDPCYDTIVNFGALYVLPKHRGRGLAHNMCSQAEFGPKSKST